LQYFTHLILYCTFMISLIFGIAQRMTFAITFEPPDCRRGHKGLGTLIPPAPRHLLPAVTKDGINALWIGRCSIPGTEKRLFFSKASRPALVTTQPQRVGGQVKLSLRVSNHPSRLMLWLRISGIIQLLSHLY